MSNIIKLGHLLSGQKIHERHFIRSCILAVDGKDFFVAYTMLAVIPFGFRKTDISSAAPSLSYTFLSPGRNLQPLALQASYPRMSFFYKTVGAILFAG